MLHLCLSCLGLLELYVKLLEFRLSTPKLRHCLIVVHLLDLVVLELLLVKFLSTGSALIGLLVNHL